MKTKPQGLFALFVFIDLLGTLAAGAADAPAAGPFQPWRVNKAIELLESGQPVYYDYGAGGYEAGRAAAKTWADILLYDMEAEAMDFTQLRAFMQGLADGGPTPSGHRIPAVIVTLPLYG